MSANSMRRLVKENKKEDKQKKRRAKKEEKRRRSLHSSLDSFTSSGESLDVNENQEGLRLEKMDDSNKAPDRKTIMETTGRNNSLRLSELEDEENETKPSDRSKPSHDSFHTSCDTFDDDEGSVSLEDIVGLKNQPIIHVSDQFSGVISEMGSTVTCSEKTNQVRDDVGTAPRTLRQSLPNNFRQTVPSAPDKKPKLEDSKTTKQTQTAKKLLPATTTQNASWFADRGLMSRKSLKFMKKENKKKAKAKPKPLIDLDDVSVDSSISGLNEQNESSNINGSSADDGLSNYVIGDEEKKIDDTDSALRGSMPSLLSSHGSQQKVSFRQRVSEIDDDDNLSLDEGLHKMHVTIQVPRKYNGTDISALDFNWKTSSRSLQDYWAENDRGCSNENDSSSDSEDEVTPSQQRSLLFPEQSVNSDDCHADIEKIETLYSIPSDVSRAGEQSPIQGSILRGNTQNRNSGSSSQRRVSWITTSSEPILEHHTKREQGVSLVEDFTRDDASESSPTSCDRSNLQLFENEVSEQRPPVFDQPDLAQGKDSQAEKRDFVANLEISELKDTSGLSDGEGNEDAVHNPTPPRNKTSSESGRSIGEPDREPSEDKDAAPMFSPLQTGLDNMRSASATILRDDVEEERNRAFAEIIQSVLESKAERKKVGLSSEEVTVLHKMVKKLSIQEGESSHSTDDAPVKQANSLLEEEPVPVQNMKGSLNSAITLKVSNESQLQAEMLAKVARDMSASLERSRSKRLKQGPSNEEGTAEKSSEPKPATSLLLAKRPPPVEQPSRARKVCPQERAAKAATSRDSKDTNRIPGDVNTVRDVTTNTKCTLQDLIEGNNKSSVSHAPRDQLNIGSTCCLDSPSFADREDPPSSRQQRHHEFEALQSPNDVIHKKDDKNVRPIASTSIESYEDILTLGINNLSVTMLVNIYGRLREMSLLGHASVMLRDIDVNSHQRNSRMKELRRLQLLNPEEENKGYLETTLTAGYIVRAAIDEYEILDSSPVNGALSHVKKASLEYDATMVSDFKAWVAESLTKEFDGQCFKEGSVMRDLVDSSLEVVWISDRHPSDVNYCICVNRVASRVIVVFRGDEGVLRRVKDSKMMEYENPLAEELGNTEFIRLRAAVSKNILFPRLDTKMTIVEEIHSRVNKIRSELTGRDPCHVTICGHSLGGGLATVTGFYLACNNDLKLASPIQIVTFASPRVGGKEFHRCFQHLEDSGRLLYARFTNVNDMISLRPFWAISGSWRFEDWYKVSDTIRVLITILSLPCAQHSLPEKLSYGSMSGCTFA